MYRKVVEKLSELEETFDGQGSVWQINRKEQGCLGRWRWYIEAEKAVKEKKDRRSGRIV